MIRSISIVAVLIAGFAAAGFVGPGLPITAFDEGPTITGECEPSDTYVSLNGILCATTLYSCGAYQVGGGHSAGNCANEPANCYHNPGVILSQCGPKIDWVKFDGGWHVLTGSGPWLFSAQSANPPCDGSITRSVELYDGIVNVGSKTMKFECDSCE